jgi:membrane protein
MITTSKSTFREFIRKCQEDNISAYASQAAFFIILSMIPFFMLLLSLLQYTPVTEGMILNLINDMVPSYLAPFLISVIHEVYTKNAGLISLTAIVAIWSAAKGTQHLSSGLNAVYDIMETRSWLFLRIRAIEQTLFMLVALIMSLILMIFGNTIQDLLILYVPWLGNTIASVLNRRTPYILFVLCIFFLIMYKALPNRKVSLRSQLPGSILCAVGWAVFSFGLSIYLDYFNGFSMYGSLTTIVLVMLWLYICIYIMLVCAEINNIYEDRQIQKFE